MNKEEILAMVAGNELDGLVAEKVFGLRIDERKAGHWAVWDKNEKWDWMKKYSTDISAAWEAFVRFDFPILEKGFDEDDKDYFVCEIGNHRVIQDTAPEAISKAALLAVIDS